MATEPMQPPPPLAPSTPVTILSFALTTRTRVALPSRWVQEVLSPHALTPMPGAPSHVSGIAQIGGRPVPVVDLVPFFGLGDGDVPADDEMPRLVLVHSGAMEVALVGRSVLVEDLDVDEHEVREQMFGERLRPHVQGRVKTRRGVAIVLDLPSVLEAARVRS